MEKKDILLEAKGIRKVYGPTVALDDVDMTVYRGEIRGLIGENGSGKSTISSIISGMQQPNKGEMTYKGQPHRPETMIKGLELGIGMIVQEMGTISGITVAQNIFLGKEKDFSKYGFISKKAMNDAAREALEQIGVTDIGPQMYIDALDMQDRKLIEVAKVMYNNPEILIVDETTTALSQKGRTIVYDLMQKMKDAGNAVLFVSHDLEEVMEHCDSLTVLRDGHLIDTLSKSEFEEERIKQLMVGREMSGHYYRGDNVCSYEDEIILKVENLTTGHGLTENINFELHKGEILGIGGLSHCGMHELGRAVFGAEKTVTGKVTYVPDNKEINDPLTAMNLDMGYVSKNRDLEALVLTASIKDNIVGAGFDKVSKHGFITPWSEKKYVQSQVDQMSIKCADMDQQVKFLSGGNKQKVVFSKWLARDAKTLILDCPTRGIDIGVKSAMYTLMEEMKAEGKAILMISEELTELLGMCDRLMVMKDGQIKGELKRGEIFDENAVIEKMI